MSFSRIAIIGPGLLGASVSLAIRQCLTGEAKPIKISLWARREPAVAELRQRQIADLVSNDLAEVTDGADLIVLATPVGVMGGMLAKILQCDTFSKGAVVTDVGSVKDSVLRELDGLIGERDDVHFVGSHPMAGSERTGAENARGDLFSNAACILTPGRTSRGDSVVRVERFWQGLGCRVLRMGASEHDLAVAKISHLPHLVASALVNSSLEGDVSVATLAAGGFRDTTRVASGSPSMWAEIALENRAALREPLERMIGELRDLLAFLDGMKHEDLLRFLEKAKNLRDVLHVAPANESLD